ncbi:hypothetical protein Cni_G01347 [Canna indica]|uniref:Uncharacterized protein n=1 Tax=Canna indica TaxID=4628 RepID=A0AAQ3JN02_9LILI|nr:hypothetical protein Cni_G01347 [Canna indica]
MRSMLLSFVLLLFLQAKWSVASENSHGSKYQVKQPPQLSDDQSVYGVNVKVKLSNVDASTEKWGNYSKKSIPGGSHSAHQSSSGTSTSMYPCLLVRGLAFLLFLFTFS